MSESVNKKDFNDQLVEAMKLINANSTEIKSLRADHEKHR